MWKWIKRHPIWTWLILYLSFAGFLGAIGASDLINENYGLFFWFIAGILWLIIKIKRAIGKKHLTNQ